MVLLERKLDPFGHIFPKYVVLKSDLSSNLVVSTISDLTPSYISKYSSFDLSQLSTRLTSNKESFIFLPFLSLTTLLNFTSLIVME